MADDQPFYAPNRTRAPARQAQPGERLFEFLRGHDRIGKIAQRARRLVPDVCDDKSQKITCSGTAAGA